MQPITKTGSKIERRLLLRPWYRGASWPVCTLRQRCRAIGVSLLLFVFACMVPMLAIDVDLCNDADGVFVRLFFKPTIGPTCRRRDRPRPSLVSGVASALRSRRALPRRSSHSSHHNVTRSRRPAFERVVSTEL
jgi:hypothetical protein